MIKENKHLPYGGSTAGRLLQCNNWRNEADKYPKPKANVYANEGNLLHDCMEEYYTDFTQFETMLEQGRSYNGVKMEDFHLAYLNTALKATEGVLDKYDIDLYECEPFVEYVKDTSGGSIDLIGVSTDYTTTMILDYKFGHGAVPVEKNPSLMFYALAALHDENTFQFFKETKKIVYVIIQPKLSGKALVWESDIRALLDFKENYDEALNRALKGKASLNSGKYCQYCPAAPYCSEVKEMAVAASVLNPKNSEVLSENLKMVELLKTWISAVEDEARNRLGQGAKIEGFKLVQKQARTQWLHEEEAAKRMSVAIGEEAFNMKLKTPNQIKKLGGEIDDLVIKKSSGTIVVPESDKRPGINISDVSDKLKNLVKSSQ